MSKKKHSHKPNRTAAPTAQPQAERQPNAPKVSVFRAFLCQWGWCQPGEWTYETQQPHPAYCQQKQLCLHCSRVDATRHLGKHTWGDYAYIGTSCEQQTRCVTCGASRTRLQHDWGEELVLPRGNHSYVRVSECKRCHTKVSEKGCHHEWEYKYYDAEFHQFWCPHCGTSKLEPHRLRYTGSVYDDSYYCDTCNRRI